MVESAVAKAQIGRIELRREQPPHHVEDLGRRTLERKDRLLFVADREQRAAGIGPAAARHELGRYSLNDLPLLRLVSCASSIKI